MISKKELYNGKLFATILDTVRQNRLDQLEGDKVYVKIEPDGGIGFEIINENGGDPSDRATFGLSIGEWREMCRDIDALILELGIRE